MDELIDGEGRPFILCEPCLSVITTGVRNREKDDRESDSGVKTYIHDDESSHHMNPRVFDEGARTTFVLSYAVGLQQEIGDQMSEIKLEEYQHPKHQLHPGVGAAPNCTHLRVTDVMQEIRKKFRCHFELMPARCR